MINGPDDLLVRVALYEHVLGMSLRFFGKHSTGKLINRLMGDSSALLQQLQKISESGYAVDLGEHIADVRSVAVPVRDYTHAVVGSLAIAGPAYRLSLERIDKEIVPLMLKAGRVLSTRLGFEAE